MEHAGDRVEGHVVTVVKCEHGPLRLVESRSNRGTRALLCAASSLQAGSRAGQIDQRYSVSVAGSRFGENG